MSDHTAEAVVPVTMEAVLLIEYPKRPAPYKPPEFVLPNGASAEPVVPYKELPTANGAFAVPYWKSR
jgi:hypothetical protein